MLSRKTGSSSRRQPSPRSAPRQRQRTGRACEECRRRKLRCDGQQPRCGVCVESGVPCEVNSQRALRGPKKGYLKALRNRVALLETRLAEQTAECNPLSTPVTDLQDVSSTSTAFESNLAPLSARSPSASEPEVVATTMTRASMTPQARTLSIKPVSELIQAELNQLYFDRVHPSIQILHQRRYMSWARCTVESTSRQCLQYAMWTLASLHSAQFRHLQVSFYQETKRMLDQLTRDTNFLVDTEEIQAWILTATYESMRTFHRSAWMSAGRAFRLVQLMRLHEIDNPTNAPVHVPVLETELIETEEKRRVFWMAYFLDHLFSMRNNWPVTLNEHVICTRLPAPEMEFQSGQPVLGVFLSEAIMDHSRATSPFNECVILATICGRSLFHVQQHKIGFVYGGDITPTWSEQHQWLDNILINRLQVLSQYHPSPMQFCDSMLLFAHIMGQATVIYLYQGMKSVLRTIDERTLVVNKQRALVAAQEVVTLAKALTESHLFKVHPLMPIPLLLCAEFLDDGHATEGFNSQLQELLRIFHQLKNVNDPSQSYIQLLELSCTAASMDLARKHSTVSTSSSS
ncbi:hypothetical protein ANOM_007809 [Aspergillus nomiae NRRL 13137]|uniref:Zn(2)-C6 fungal-type domain-containing protein n=1 Tax=Aspergillus nomiae NRRL (strain ATCC 15546 / NRRL 13137 / CBS 260.88 / M93) TaxID=1509407 RepID=A0A0L1IZU2_ASPN3|nr:uncharacterized protein ANOM_007809 [Aspergillus nomiae NRRL 13137]KNG85002.1 hypothetical protein ANOM_007809 [Aspergillus nomiae NRRL 13137]